MVASGSLVVPDSAGVRGAVSEANFAQPKIRSDELFSPEGQRVYSELLGREVEGVDDLANALRNREVNPSQIPVDYIDLDGTRLMLNTRTSTALTRAEIPRSEWYGVNRTGQVADIETGMTFDDLAHAQLNRNTKYAVPGQIGWPELLSKGKK